MVAQSIKQPESAQEAHSNMRRANGVFARLQGGASTQQIKSTGCLLFEAVLGRVLAN
jgi:hypothetical protein